MRLTAPETSPRLTMPEVAWFFFPLLLNMQMMSISHSIINAGLARVTDAIIALASVCSSRSAAERGRRYPGCRWGCCAWA